MYIFCKLLKDIGRKTKPLFILTDIVNEVSKPQATFRAK